MVKRIIALMMIALIALSTVSACTNNAERPLTAAELISLGERYLLDLNFEQARVQFALLIEVEPMNPRGYTGLAEAYIGLGQPENAATILEQGLAVVAQEDLSSLQILLDEVETILITTEGLVDIPPLLPEEDYYEEIQEPEPVPLAITADSAFEFIGASPDVLATVLGAYDDVTPGDYGTMFRFGHIHVAFDRDYAAIQDGLAYLVISPLSAVVGYESGHTVDVSALDELFGQAGEIEPGVLQYTYQGINVLIEGVPADGIIPIEHIVVISVEPREPEPTPTPQPTPPPPPPPMPTPELAPVPPIPEYFYEDYEIELDVLR